MKILEYLEDMKENHFDFYPIPISYLINIFIYRYTDIDRENK